MNPYAKFIGDRQPQTVISETSQRLKGVVETLGDKGMEVAPAPGKWNAREILSHLADCEIAFGFRLRQALAEDNHVIQPFDQDGWARSYTSYNGREACDTFAALRAWNLSLLRGVPQAALSKKLSHPERGEMTFQTVIETMAGHDLNHLGQLDAIVAQAAK
jgi:DinB superfamily